MPILNRSQVKTLIKQRAPTLKVSSAYLDELEEVTQQQIIKDVIRNKEKTLQPEIIHEYNGRR